MFIKILKTKYLYFALAISLFLGACAEDGEPGPKGEQGEQGLAGNDSYFKLGSLEGTFSGTRRDGTAFSEPFSFEYTSDSLLAFSEENGEKLIYISRNGRNGRMYMELKQTDEGYLVSTLSPYSTYFNFTKALDEESLFEIKARPYFVPKEAFTLRLSREKQATYNFNTGTNSNPMVVDVYFSPSGTNEYRAAAYINDTYHYVFYSKTDGTLLSLYNHNTGEYITEGEAFDHYNELKYMYNAEVDQSVFYDAATEEPLYEEIPDVPADVVTIKNFNHDENTGIITFDFEIKISQYDIYTRTNSTQNDLTITGSFSSGNRVYKNTVNRIAAD